MEILGIVIDPSMRLAAFTILYTFFFLFVYLLLYSFSHLLQEHNVRGQDSPAAVAATPASHAQQE